MTVWTISNWFPFAASVGLKSVAVLGAAWAIAFMMRKQTAAARHLVWTSATAAVLLLPLLALCLPRLSVPWDAAVPLLVFRADAIIPAPHLTQPAAAPLATIPVATASTRSFDWRAAFLLAWAAGSALFLIQTVAAYFSMARLRRQARPARMCDAALLGLEATVEILETPSKVAPLAFGILRPAVLLPNEANRWSEDRRRVVLLHELAHVRRLDLVTHLIARLAVCAHWWNPLIWVAWRSFLKERERATDDLVLSAGTRASEYAAHLLDIARGMERSPAVAWAAVAMARQSQLEGRLRAILDSNVSRAPLSRAAAWVALAAALAVVSPLAALRGQEKSVKVLPSDVDATIQAAVSQRNFEMLDGIARTAMLQRKYDVARKLLDASLGIRGTVSGESGGDYAIGLMHLGGLERRRGQGATANEFYSKAIALVGDRTETAEGLIHLGTTALVNKDLAAATTYLERARIADASHPAKALMWLAVIAGKRKNFQEAGDLFQQSIAAAEPHSVEAATPMELFAQFLEAQGRGEEAKPYREQAQTIRKASVLERFESGTVFAAASKIGNGVTAPSLLFKLEPEYSDEARAAQYQGTAIVMVSIGTDGKVYQSQVVRSLGLGLDEKAVDAILQWRFKPGTKDGQPVNVTATIEVNFRLL